MCHASQIADLLGSSCVPRYPLPAPLKDILREFPLFRPHTPSELSLLSLSDHRTVPISPQTICIVVCRMSQTVFVIRRFLFLHSYTFRGGTVYFGFCIPLVNTVINSISPKCNDKSISHSVTCTQIPGLLHTHAHTHLPSEPLLWLQAPCPPSRGRPGLGQHVLPVSPMSSRPSFCLSPGYLPEHVTRWLRNFQQLPVAHSSSLPNYPTPTLGKMVFHHLA